MTLRIALVAHHALGGSGVMAIEWARLLAESGHDITLFRTGTGVREPLLHPSGALGGLAQVVVEAPPHPVLDGPSHVAAMTSALMDAHALTPFDVVHIHYALPFALLAPLLRSQPNAPRVVVSLHGTDVTGIGVAPAYRSAMRAALRCCDDVTAPSRWLAEQAREALGVERAVVLQNFVDLRRFAPPLNEDRPDVRSLFGTDDGTPIIVHASNFRSVKRVHDVVDAIAAMPRPARLLMVGDGPDRESALQRASTALAGNVAAVGATDDPVRWFQQSDALLLTSASESFGLAALEALACGTPVVASRVGGLPEWLDDVGPSRLCPVGDVHAFARALTEVLSPPNDRATIRAQARAIACRVGDPAEAARAAFDLYTHP